MVRGVLALMVVVWHTIGYNGELPTIINLPGRTAVWIFFGISGYVISYGFLKKNYKFNRISLFQFYKRRIIRIYSIFFIVSIAALLTELILSKKLPFHSNFDFVIEFLMLKFEHDYILNGVFWTLGVEFHFYLIAPFICVILLRGSLRYNANYLWLICLFYLSVYFGLFVFFLHWSVDSRNILGNLNHFLVGIISAIVFDKTDDRFLGELKFKTLLMIFLVLICVSNLLYHVYPVFYWYGAGPLLVDLSIIVMCMAEKKFLFQTKNIVLDFLMLCGLLSFGIYAWHGYWLKYFPSYSDPFLLIFISLGSSITSYFIIEKPIDSITKKKVLN